MKHTKALHNLVRGAAIAALYVVLALAQDLLLPGTTSAAIQFRAAEALCVLALYTPSAVGGLTAGCLLFNLTNAGALPLDPLVGPLASLLSAVLMYRLRNVRLWRVPAPALAMPAVCNALLVGPELWFYVPGLPLWLDMLYVALGELCVLYTLGTALYFALRPIESRLK